MKKLIEKIAKEYFIDLGFKKNGKLIKKSLEEFQDKVNWFYTSRYQDLSEEFIREFQDKVNWYYISQYQDLSEDFIREFQDKIYWGCISAFQILSEDFIREFQDKIDWFYISKYQKLSEEFMREFQDKVKWFCISKYQKLSKKFREEFDIKIPKTCWLYKSVNFKLKYLKENTDYEIIDNKYIIAYKSVRSDMSSVYRPTRYKYEVGKTYTSNCDYNIDEENSFGLSAWTKKRAIRYYANGVLLKVKIDIKDIGAIVQENQKIRCCKQTILEII